MVKKLKFLLFFLPFLFITNVNAEVLSPPTFFQHFQDDSITSSTASAVANWSQTDVYVGGLIGDFGTNTNHIYQVDYNWLNLNICSGMNVSVSGSVHAIYGFFLQQNYSISFYMNSKPLTCSTSVFDNGNALHYDCYGKTGGGTFAIYLTENSFTTNTNYNTAVSRNVNYSCDVSNESIVNQSITNTQNIINNNNSNTNSIIQNQDGNTQDIINNQNQNAQDIINNQNSNTEKEIESQKVCITEIIDKSKISFPNSALTFGDSSIGNGNISPSNTFSVTDYIYIKNATNFKNTLNISTNSNVYFCFYNDNKEYISCLSKNNYNNNNNISIPSNATYARFTLDSSTNRPQFTFDICKNGNQALTDSITSENVPNTSSELNDLDSSTASDTPISDLITLPITLINVFINGINSSCSPVNLGNLYGTDLTFPCIDIEQIIGSNLWSTIDILFSIFMCYNIGMLFVTAFSGITSLRDDFDSLYQPKHADTGYQPKHGG